MQSVGCGAAVCFPLWFHQSVVRQAAVQSARIQDFEHSLPTFGWIRFLFCAFTSKLRQTEAGDSLDIHQMRYSTPPDLKNF